MSVYTGTPTGFELVCRACKVVVMLMVVVILLVHVLVVTIGTERRDVSTAATCVWRKSQICASHTLHQPTHTPQLRGKRDLLISVIPVNILEQ